MSKLREWRHSKDITQDQFAAKVGTTGASISRIEVGDQWPSPSLLMEIEKATRGAVTAAAILADYQRVKLARSKRRPSIAAAE